MKGLDIVGILKVGLPGLVFLLSALSYQLIAKGVQKKQLGDSVVATIRSYMYVNVVLALLTLAASALDHVLAQSPADRGINKEFTVEARAGGRNLGSGTAVVCQNAAYNGRYLLVSTQDRSSLIQVFAHSPMPCEKPDQIALSDLDLKRLRWPPGAAAGRVQVVVAAPGQKFVMDDGNPGVAAGDRSVEVATASVEPKL